MTTSKQRRQEIVEREKKATKGPYEKPVCRGSWFFRDNCGKCERCIADIERIAKSYHDIPYLLALVDEQEALLRDAVKEMEAAKDVMDESGYCGAAAIAKSFIARLRSHLA